MSASQPPGRTALQGDSKAPSRAGGPQPPPEVENQHPPRGCHPQQEEGDDKEERNEMEESDEKEEDKEMKEAETIPVIRKFKFKQLEENSGEGTIFSLFRFISQLQDYCHRLTYLFTSVVQTMLSSCSTCASICFRHR